MSETPHDRLLHDHQEIENLLQDLLVAYDSGERAIATPAFQALDRRLSAHLAFEDEVLIPALEQLDAPEAGELAAEHRAIRARVDALGIADNLHLSRANEVHAIVEMLRAHAKRENETLYRLADRLAHSPAA